ncbi:CPBP family intramembrane metalloprotease [Lactobacillus sp. S2-2]|uniref:CPBP family intramembrane glutamic endopeptidase n=1 Tax=Lactobacillus sp. S2-2 TaxID=2692917 RepID=UPI001F2205DE|nr:CPBP family intramembrane glutamic endopeptidase [Lactobacillus sp. S2-2]MCF6515445.1 CPBP family intramembrane metalloprotease [Lactobacillus sp. S2-2]
MFETIKNSKIHNVRTIFSLFIILIGTIYGFSNYHVSWFTFFVVGLLALILQFDISTIKNLFFKMKKKSFKYILLTVLFAFIFSTVFTLLGKLLGQTISANTVITKLEDVDFIRKIIALLKMIISLSGEEIIVAAAFFPILKYSSFKFNKKASYFIAIVVSCLFFGLLHFRAYNWNLYQMFIVIGLNRIWFEYAWIKTNSIFGGIIAHIMYDFILMLPIIFM